MFRQEDFSQWRTVDAPRRLNGPSNLEINGEQASGFEDMLPGAAI